MVVSLISLYEFLSFPRKFRLLEVREGEGRGLMGGAIQPALTYQFALFYQYISEFRHEPRRTMLFGDDYSDDCVISEEGQ